MNLDEKANFLMKYILIYSIIMVSAVCLCAYTFSFETKVDRVEKYKIYFKDDGQLQSVNIDKNSFYDIKSGDTIRVEKSILGINRIYNDQTKSFVTLQEEE